MQSLNRCDVLIGAATTLAAAALPVAAVAEGAVTEVVTPPFKPLFEGLGLIGFEPPHPWGSWAWMNAIEEAIWTPTEDLKAGLCPCALCSIARDGS